MILTLPPTSSSRPDLRRAVARTLGDVTDDIIAEVLLARAGRRLCTQR